MKPIVVAALSGIAWAGQALGQGVGFIESRGEMDCFLGDGACEDFETFEVADGQSVNTGCRAINCNSVCSGQGPGLVDCGALYQNLHNSGLNWLGAGHVGMPSRCLRGREGMFIGYAVPVQVMGFDLRTQNNAPFEADVRFLDAQGQTLAHRIYPVENTTGVFVGLRHPDGIAQITIICGENRFPIVDDHCYSVGASDPCAAGAVLKTKCRTKSCGPVVKAVLKNAKPGCAVTFQLNGGDDLVRTISERGKAKAKWCPGLDGENVVDVLECGMSSSIECG